MLPPAPLLRWHGCCCVGTAAVVAPMLVGTAAAVAAAARCVLGGLSPVRSVRSPSRQQPAGPWNVPPVAGVTNSPVPKCFPPFQLPSPAQ